MYAHLQEQMIGSFPFFLKKKTTKNFIGSRLEK